MLTDSIRDVVMRADRMRVKATQGATGWVYRKLALEDESSPEEQRDIRRRAENAARLRLRVKKLGCWFPQDGAP